MKRLLLSSLFLLLACGCQTGPPAVGPVLILPDPVPEQGSVYAYWLVCENLGGRWGDSEAVLCFWELVYSTEGGQREDPK